MDANAATLTPVFHPEPAPETSEIASEFLERPTPESTPEAAPASPPANWTARLLHIDESSGVRAEAVRYATGLGLSAVYGMAIGARHGGLALLKSAAVVPAALVAATALGVPATYIVLALFDAPIDPKRLGAATSRAVATTGLVLAGLAPAAALFVVSSEQPAAAGASAALGLMLGSFAGYRALMGDVLRGLSRANEGVRFASAAAIIGFGVFAAALALRIWSAALPLFGGGR
jgi:hypothetical protein